MSFYRALPSQLCQGDISVDVPWGLISAPTTLCRPINSAPHGKADYSTADPWNLTNAAGRPKPWSKTPEIIHASGWKGAAIALWHDCQIDKTSNQGAPDAKAFVAVAPILPMDDAPKDLQPAIRDGRHFSYFHLPAGEESGNQIAESYVNFRYIWSVRQSVMWTGRRLSLSGDALQSLHEALFVFFTRTRLDLSPTCPTCGTVVTLTAVDPAPE